MLALTGGRERAQAEYAGLHERAGLRLARAVPTGREQVVMEAGRQ